MDNSQILSTLLSKCTNTKNKRYIKRYLNYILACREYNLKSKPLKVEAHHICPKAKSLFPEYKSFKLHPWNKVELTLKQHYNAHYLLAKSFGGSMWTTLSWFRRFEELDLTSQSNSKRYEESKINIAAVASEKIKASWTAERKAKQAEDFTAEGNPFYKKTHTKETRTKIKEARANQVFSEESRRKNSESNRGEKNHFHGKSHSEESLEKMKLTLAALEPLTCPFCNKSSKSRANMKRYHFNNCKFQNRLF